MEGVVAVNSVNIQVSTEISDMTGMRNIHGFHALNALFALSATLLTMQATAEVADQLDFTYYTALANTGKSLANSLREATPFKDNGHVFFGHTARQIDWRLHWNNTASGGCKITEVRVTLHTTITLPQLIGADATRQDEFTRFLLALRIHEIGHYRIEQQAAAAIDAAMWSLGEMRNCSEMEDTANATGNHLLEEYNQREAQYDAATGHGKTQGAFFN